MKKRLLGIKQEMKMDLYFATTFGFLIPIAYPTVDIFSNTFQISITLSILNCILFSLYILANIVYFKTDKIRNTISNFIGIISYLFLAIPIFNIVKSQLDMDNINLVGVIVSVVIFFSLKILKSLIDKNVD